MKGISKKTKAVFGALALLITSLTLSPAAHATFPGQNGKIAFASTGGIGGISNIDIYVINPDGTGWTNLTNYPGIDFSPAWSPSGTKIAFASDRDGEFLYEIYVMNADGSGQTRLTNNPARDSDPQGRRLVSNSSCFSKKLYFCLRVRS